LDNDTSVQYAGSPFEQYEAVDGPEVSSSIDSNLAGDENWNNSVGLERLQDQWDTICSENVQATRVSEEGDWKISIYLETSIGRSIS
jgi:hypothetical protein